MALILLSNLFGIFMVNCWKPYFKEGLPYLFHSFRNKYFNKISLGNMLYFQNKLQKFLENAWFSDKYAMKNNLQNKMQIIFFLVATNNIEFNHVCHVIVYR